MKKLRGGRRRGAGRPKLANKMVIAPFRLPAEFVAAIRETAAATGKSPAELLRILSGE